MIDKVTAIVLSKLNYRDSDLIVHCYTREQGVVSYILKGVLKSKKKKMAAYFQPLSLLEIQQNFKPTRNLQYVKEVKSAHHYTSLHTNVYKSAVVMFLSEILTSVLKEEEANEGLFNYLETSFLLLDKEERFANFHLLFLLNLTRFLGIYPDTSQRHLPYFNLYEAQFEPVKSNFYSISEENLGLLKQLLGTDFDGLKDIKLQSQQRNAFIQMLMLYFELHIAGFKKPKSLEVLNALFN